MTTSRFMSSLFFPLPMIGFEPRLHVGADQRTIGLKHFFFFFDRKPRMNILIEKEVQKEDEESSRQK